MSIHWLAFSGLSPQTSRSRQPPIGPPREHFESRLRCQLRLSMPQTGKVHGQDEVRKGGRKLRKWLLLIGEQIHERLGRVGGLKAQETVG